MTDEELQHVGPGTLLTWDSGKGRFLVEFTAVVLRRPESDPLWIVRYAGYATFHVIATSLTYPTAHELLTLEGPT